MKAKRYSNRYIQHQ